MIDKIRSVKAVSDVAIAELSHLFLSGLVVCYFSHSLALGLSYVLLLRWH